MNSIDIKNKISSKTDRKVVYADDVIKALQNCCKYDIDMFDSYRIDIQDAEYAVIQLQSACKDCGYKGLYEQVKWERDVAIEQLNELGYSLGEKIKDKNV